MGKVMRHTLGASLNIRHNLSSSKGPKPLQLKLLTTYIPKTRSEERFSRNAETDLVCRLLLEKKNKRMIEVGSQLLTCRCVQCASFLRCNNARDTLAIVLCSPQLP